jgi:diacylglycerol kinase family enzyme
MVNALSAVRRLPGCGVVMMPDLEARLGIKLPFHLIYNPVAGVNSTAVAEYVRNTLSSDVIEMNRTKGPKDVTRIVSEKMESVNANSGLKEAFIIIGGDGTANEAVNASGDLTNAIFIFAGGGTGRDIARTLNTMDYVRTCNLLNKVLTGKASLEDYVKATDLIKVQYDEGKQVRAVNLFSIGIDGLICKEVNTTRTKGGFGKKNVFITKTLTSLLVSHIYLIMNLHPEI